MSNHFKEKQGEGRAVITANQELDKYTRQGLNINQEVRGVVLVAVQRLEDPSVAKVRHEVRDVLEKKGLLKAERVEMPVPKKAGKEYGEAQIIMQLTGDLNNYGLSLTDREFNQVVDYVKSKNPKSHEELISRIDAGLGLIGYGRKTLEEQRQTVDEDKRIAKLTGYKGPGDYGVAPGVRELEPTSVVAKAETPAQEKQRKHAERVAARKEAKATAAREAAEVRAAATAKRAADKAAKEKEDEQRKAGLLAKREERKKAEAADKKAEQAQLATEAARANADRIAAQKAAAAAVKAREEAAKAPRPEVARAEPGTARAAKREDILAKLLGALKTDKVLETSTGPNKEELERQIRGEGVATGDAKGALAGPAQRKGKGEGEVAEIKQIRMKGGDKDVKTEERREEQQQVFTARTARKTTPEKKEPGVAEVTVSELEGIVRNTVIELSNRTSALYKLEKFLENYEIARANFKQGQESGLKENDPRMQGWAKEAYQAREKVQGVLPEIRNFKKMCDALRENAPESNALEGAQSTLTRVDNLIRRWEA